MVAVPVLCLLALAITYARREEHSAGSVSFSIHPPDDGKIASGGLLSPDGTRIAFITSDASGARKLWVRSIDSVDAVSLPGTDGAKLPFWSPDSRRLGFFANGLLMTVEIGGGFPQTVVPVSTAPTGGTWNEDDIILFASRRSGLFQVPAAGGIPTPLTVLDSALRETSHNWPQFLPDGRHFLYTIRSANTALNGVYVGSLDDPTLKRQVLETTSGSVYAGGRIFFVREGALRSQAFDTATLRTTGPSEFVAPNVPVPDGAFGMTFSAVNVGFTYLSPSPPRRQTWFDRSGKELGTLESTAVLSRVALSPDEQHVAGSDHSSPTYGIWLFDLARGTAFRLAANGDNAVWSPDGNDIYFVSSQASGILDVYRKPAYGPDQAELILSNGQSMWPVDISADGRYLVYTSDHSKSQLDLWVLPLFGDRTPFPYLNTPANEIQGRPSPDGRWMAYTSDETGRWEVYLQTFPMAGGKRRVSVAGGAQPFWRRDGRELFYLSLDRKLMSVEIRDNGTLHIGHAKPLFQTRTRDDLTAIRNDYTVTADGNRFLIESQAEAKSQTITVVINQLPTFDE